MRCSRSVATRTHGGCCRASPERPVLDAGVALHLPLRSGALLRQIERRAGINGLLLPRALYMIPLRRVRGSGRGTAVRTETGLATSVAALIEAERGVGWSPRYDFEYVDWQIGRSPVLASQTSFSPAQGEPRAAALYWRPQASVEFWRLALWAGPDSADHLGAVLGEAVSRVYEARGTGPFDHRLAVGCRPAGPASFCGLPPESSASSLPMHGGWQRKTGL